MKYLYIFILLFCVPSCDSNNIEDENIVACGVHQPQQNLSWLASLIETAEADTTGNCLGTIWLVSYKGKDIFVTNMMLGSGGIANWFFDCSGKCFTRRDGEQSYSPLKYVGNGHAFFEDEEEIFSYISTLRFDLENKDIPVIYSNVPF